MLLHSWFLNLNLMDEKSRRGSNNPISDTVSMLVACLHAKACGLQMSLISADSSWEFLMLGSHAFSSGLSQAAAGSICDSCSNLPLHRCHIENTNWAQAYIYIRAAFDDAFLVVTLPLTQPRFHHRDKVKVKPSNLNVHYSCTKCGIYLLFKFPFFLFVAYSNIKMLYVDILCTINNPESVLGLLNSRDHQNHIDPQEISRIKQWKNYLLGVQGQYKPVFYWFQWACCLWDIAV